MDVTGKVLWRHKQRAALMTAALTTAGGLAFVGDYDRYLRAYDVKTGAVLWQTRTNTSPHGFPISYAVRGKRYLAVPVGVGGGSWSTTMPAQLTPEIKTPAAGNALYVFALPGGFADKTTRPLIARSEGAGKCRVSAVRSFVGALTVE
jgi:alcohol dehydrogenase (cytochrome c)